MAKKYTAENNESLRYQAEAGVIPGRKCKMCGFTYGEPVDIDCQGAKERGEEPKFVVPCPCLHYGDYICSCGKPCWSFF